MKRNLKLLNYELGDIEAILRTKIKNGYIKKNVFYSSTDLMLLTGYKDNQIKNKSKSDFCKLLNENEFYYDTKERKWIIN